MEKRQRGFTLVELMVASLLAGIVLVIALPLILVGRNTDVRTEKKEAIAMAGDAIYEYIADEMKFAGQLYLGDLQDKKPVGENWKSITASEKDPETGENYARLLFGAARELTAGESADPGSPLYDEVYQEKTDLVIEAEAVGQTQLRLTVKLMGGGQALYEKSSVLSLLNLTLNATRQIEGYVGGPMTTAVYTEAASGVGEEEDAFNSPVLHSLVLWYKSSRETVSPFVEGDLGTGDLDDLIPGPGSAVVSLANPQYVKAGQFSEIQYKVQAGSGHTIERYEWSIVDGTNNTEDGSFYIKDPQWDQSAMKYTVEGLNATPDNHVVTLGLTVFFRSDRDGSESSLSDSCSVIVYEGNKPGEGPVDHFVIVPDGLEELYAKNSSYPAWIRSGGKKLFWLEGVDKNGDIVPYSPKNWYCGYDEKVTYKGFNFVWNWTPVLLKADGEASLKGLTNGKNAALSTDGTGRNYVEMEALGMETDGSTIHRNSQAISFGGENRTAYKPNGKSGIQVSRTINIYDAEAHWKYLTDVDGTNLIDMKRGESSIQVLSTTKYVDINIGIDTKIMLGEGVSSQNEPEIDPESVKWFLEGNQIFDKNDICRFGINDRAEGAGQLTIGDNMITVEFKDTAGFFYREKVIVKVPSEVAYVKFKQDKYVLVNMNQEIDGVSIKEIEYELYDKNGNILYEGLDEDMVKEAYEASWAYTPGTVSDCPFELRIEDYVATVKARQEGTGTLELVLKEKGSGRQISGEGEDPCICTIDVMSMELQMKLRYKNNTDSGNILSTSIESGKAIPVFSNTAGLIAGFDAEIKLPTEVDRDLTDRQRNILNAIDWKKVTWKRTESNLFWGNQEWNNNIYNIGYNGGTGTEKFLVTAALDAAVNGEISVIINDAPVNTIEIENVKGNGSELVIGAGADRPNDQYNAITLKAILEGRDGRNCDTSIVWTIRSGKELVDTSNTKLNIEVDSEDSSYFPVIKLRNDLTEKDAGKKIVVRATSASSGKHAEYEITLLPEFQILYPYSPKFTLTHMSNGEKKQVPDSRKIEANREADWSIDVKSYLKFTTDANNKTSVTVETQDMISGTSVFVLTAKDILTGQTANRVITVKYEKIEEQSGSSDGWSIHLLPNGLVYMDLGETMTMEVTSGITINNELAKEGDTESIDVKFKRASNRKSGTATITAIEPGISTTYATWTLLWIWEIKSYDYIKIIVRGLKLPETYSADISRNTLNMNTLLDYGDIDEFFWESSNPNIAVISDTGIVTLLKPGKTTITVSGRANSNGKRHISKCELTVTASGWGNVKEITNSWKGLGSSTVNLLLESPLYGHAEMMPSVIGSSQHPVYYLIKANTAGKEAGDILRTEGNYAVATGEGEVSIIAGAGDKLSSPLTARVYELKAITIDSSVDGGMLNFITEGKKDLILSAKFDWGSDMPSSVPNEFKGYEWTLDEKSKEYVDITTNSDGTCTVTAKGMGAAYITCRSLANPDIYETYVVIVSF